MALNQARHVSMITFAQEYARVQKSGGNMDDLCSAVEMTKASANVKLSALRKMYSEKFGKALLPLARCPRTNKDGTKSRQKIGDLACDALAAMFAEEIPVDKVDSDDSDDYDYDTDTNELYDDETETVDEKIDTIGF